MPKKRFYKQKRFWIPIILLVLIATPFIINPLKSFRKTVTVVLKIIGIEERYLKYKNYNIHFYEGGEKNPKKVILLHGLGGNALLTWMRLMPTLTRDYHIFAPDLLASNMLYLNPNRYSIDSEVNLVLAMMDGLKIKKASFVGLSVGGWVSLIIALEHPERVDKLILIESAGIDIEVPELAKLTLTDRDKAKQFMKMLFHRPPPLPGFVLDALVRSSKKIKENYQRVFAGFVENSRGRTVDDKLGQIKHRTLLMHGRNDQVIPLEAAQKIHAGLPNSELIILENSGHAAVWDSHSELKKNILEFLGR